MRADKWLVAARFFRTRSLAAELVGGGHLRVNGRRVRKPAQAIGAGDVLTFPQAGRIRVVRVLALAQRRGPAVEARELYREIPPAPPPDPAPVPGGGPGGGPTAGPTAGIAAQGRCRGGPP